jgi:DNA-binding MarR family transcriptional regulator
MAARVTRDEIVQAAEVRTALRHFLNRTEEITALHGLSSQRYTLMLMIKASDAAEATITDLAHRLQLAQPAVTELVSRAERAGLVSRKRSSEDRRLVYVRLTNEGESRLMRAFVALRQERAALAAAFGEVVAQFEAEHGTSSTRRDRPPQRSGV